MDSKGFSFRTPNGSGLNETEAPHNCGDKPHMDLSKGSIKQSQAAIILKRNVLSTPADPNYFRKNSEAPFATNMLETTPTRQ